MRGPECTKQLCSPQTVQEADHVCTVDPNHPALFIDLEDAI